MQVNLKLCILTFMLEMSFTFSYSEHIKPMSLYMVKLLMQD